MIANEIKDDCQAVAERIGGLAVDTLQISDEELLSELERVASQLTDSPIKREFDDRGDFCSETCEPDWKLLCRTPVG